MFRLLPAHHSITKHQSFNYSQRNMYVYVFLTNASYQQYTPNSLLRSLFVSPIMHPQTIFTAVAALAISVGPALALPNAIPELELESRGQCLRGKYLVGSGCDPGHKGRTSCSADKRAVVSISSYLRQAASQLD